MHEEIRNVKTRHKAALLAKANVVSVAVGLGTVEGHETDEVCVVVGVTIKIAKSDLADEDVVPKSLDGCKIDVVEIGVIEARRIVCRYTGKLRPAKGGISIGHKDITAGTFGCLVTKNGETFILSNNHVLANSNAGEIGDAILQPGPADGGSVARDQIGTLAEFVPISFGGGGTPIPPNCPIAKFVAGTVNTFAKVYGSSHRVKAYRTEAFETPNMVDAALASPLSNDDVTAEIIDIGFPTGDAGVDLGDNIKKSGRTTGFTEGTVSQIHATISVQYGAGQIAIFEEQIISGIRSDGGDSGSAILNDANEVVWLLFAGSDRVTIFNPIFNVLTSFGVTILGH